MIRSALILSTGIFILGCQKIVDAPKEPLSMKPAALTHDQMIAKGAYLVRVAGCNDCHSPKSNPATAEVDRTRVLAGRPPNTEAPAQTKPGEISASADLTAWWGPWGNSYAANLTPDRETGLGSRYTETTFVQTMRTGKKPEGEPLLPPMPWTSYAGMTDDDLKAIYAYLMSLPPVKNYVRAATPPRTNHG
jgi:mono/diheme cytochrome c family protein